MNLHNHGIQNEDSDIRAHVSVVSKAIYVFRTQDAIEAIKEKRFTRIAGATQPGVSNKITGMGYLMPMEAIKGEGVRKVEYESEGWRNFVAKDKMSTSRKGTIAVDCVRGALRRGLFPLWVADAKEATDKVIQIAGTDIIITTKHRIQVKCDWDCGERPSGTGNLFLQYAEANPLKYF